tara:strand:- start:2069 stop:2575 length:507 start_codon:yes stop_codon:yes gene_type:complete
MARRKTKKSQPRRRSSRKMGAINTSNMLTSIGGVIAGVAAAGYLNKLALKNQSATIQAAAPIALGLAIPALLLKSEFGRFLGAGMVAYGGGKFLSQAGLAGMEEDAFSISGDDLSVVAGDFAMAGDEDEFMGGDYAMAGDEQISVLAGTEDINELASFEEDEAYASSI